MDNITKQNICIGLLVDVVSEEDKCTQKLTRGYVKKIITKGNKSKNITVVLNSGIKGIVKHIVKKSELKKENFKFYNRFFFEKKIFSIWVKNENKYLVINHLNKLNGSKEKVSFLFTDYEIGNEVLKVINNKDYILRAINRNKYIVQNFKTLDIDYFSINKTRKISYEKIQEWENYFKNMR